MKKVVIIGGKGTAIVIAEQIQDAIERFNAEYEILGFAFDDVPESGLINGWPVLCGTREAYEKYKEDKDIFFVFALYRSDLIKERTELRNSYNIPNERFLTFIHPSAVITKSVKIGKGCIVLANSVINSNAKLGDFCYLMSNVLVGHDTVIGDNNFLAAHSCIGSGLNIGNYNFFGISSNLRNFAKIGDNNIIGMGSNILIDIEDNSVVVGNPGRILRTKG